MALEADGCPLGSSLSRGSLAWLGRQTHNQSDTQTYNIETVNIDWQEYKEFIVSNLSDNYGRDILRLSKQYVDVLEYPQRASRIAILSRDKKREVMCSLSNLSKYLGIYEYWKRIIRNNGLKWEKYSALDAIVSILNSNLNDAQQWLKIVIQKIPREYGSVLVFNTLTGLRPAEACNSATLITKLSRENHLSNYLDSELMMLQHFRFKEQFLRRNKNAYISFVSQELLEALLETKPEITYSALRHKLNRLSFVSQANQLRKLHATLLRNSLPQELIDILHGRVSQSVFLRFYYKPFLQEIREKALQGIEPLQKELLALLS